MKKIAIISIILSLIAIAGEAFIFATQRDDDDKVYQEAIRRDYRVFSPIVPDTLYYAGERVPTELFYVHEGIDRELTSIMYQQLNTQLVIKRASRYFPEIDSILQSMGMPRDLRYVCVTESSLTNATSPAKAKGFWQFMEGTAKQYGLEVTDEIDMRFDYVAETKAACEYMRYLYDRFNSWTLSAAAYNRGHNGLAKQQNEQQSDSYYDMYLNTETSRYVYRILAYKIILENPQDYGFYVRKCDQYPQIPYTTAKLSGQNIDLIEYARQQNCPYKVFKMMNPWLISDKLRNPRGNTYTVKIPTEYNREKIVGKKDTSILTKV